MRGPDALTIECPCCGGHTDHDALSQTITGEWVCGPCCDELDAELRAAEDHVEAALDHDLMHELADRGALNDTVVEALAGAA